MNSLNKMGTGQSTCDCNFDDESVQALRAHLDKQYMGPFHQATTWKVVLIILAIEVVMYGLYKLYKHRKRQRAKKKVIKGHYALADLDYDYTKVARRAYHGPPTPPPYNPGMRGHYQPHMVPQGGAARRPSNGQSARRPTTGRPSTRRPARGSQCSTKPQFNEKLNSVALTLHR